MISNIAMEPCSRNRTIRENEWPNGKWPISNMFDPCENDSIMKFHVIISIKLSLFEYALMIKSYTNYRVNCTYFTHKRNIPGRNERERDPSEKGREPVAQIHATGRKKVDKNKTRQKRIGNEADNSIKQRMKSCISSLRNAFLFPYIRIFFHYFVRLPSDLQTLFFQCRQIALQHLLSIHKKSKHRKLLPKKCECFSWTNIGIKKNQKIFIESETKKR